MTSVFPEKDNFIRLGIPEENLFFYDVTDSTNTRAREVFLSSDNEDKPMLFLANGQSAGRGTRERSFESNTGKGLYFSLLLPMGFTGAKADLITPIAAAAVIDSLISLLTKENGDRLFIKWVNDIYCDRKKICGILSESIFRNDKKAYIIGIGVNLYGSDFSDELKSIAASIEEMTGEIINRERLLFEIVRRLISASLDESCDAFTDLYRKKMIKSGASVTVSNYGKPKMTASIVGLDRSLRLIVRYEDGSEETILSGDVSIKFT